MNTWKELTTNATGYGVALFSAGPVFPLAGVLAVLGGYWAQAPELWRILGVIAPGLFLLDLATGIARSLLADHRRFTSEALGRSLVKAYVYLSLFLLCLALDWSVRTGYAAQLSVLIFITVREAKSNLENLSALRAVSGVEIPGFIGKGFERLSGDEKPDKP